MNNRIILARYNNSNTYYKKAVPTPLLTNTICEDVLALNEDFDWFDWLTEMIF